MSHTGGYPSRFASQWNSAYNQEASSPLAMMSTTPKFNIRTNRQKDPFEVTGDRAPQGEVTVNLLVNPDLHKARQETGKISRTKGIQTMGTLNNIDNIQIREKDLVFVPKMQRTNNGSLYGSVKDPLAFASFTGINASTELFGNQDQFEASFYLVGKSKIPYAFGSPEQSKSGISVMTSGATTVHNNGVETFAFGDAVCWYTYDAMNDQKRESQIMNIRKARGEPPEKFGALLKRATYRDIYKLTQNALEMFVIASENNKMGEYLAAHYKDHLPSKAEFDALRRHFRAECVRGTSVDAWMTIVTLQQLGIVTINLPAQPSSADYEKIVEGLRNVNLEDLSKGSYKRISDADFTPEKVLGDLGKTENWNKALGLAHLLNVIEDNTKKVAALPSLLNVLILRKYRGLLESHHTYKYRKAASILHAGPASLMKDGLASPGSIEQKLDLIQLNTARERDSEFYAAYRRATEQIFAISISTTSGPGSNLDIVM